MLLEVLFGSTLATTAGVFYLVKEKRAEKARMEKGDASLLQVSDGVATIDLLKQMLYYTAEPSSEHTSYVFSIGLDSLKSLEEVLGRDKTTVLLKEAVSRIKGCIRSMDIVSYSRGYSLYLQVSRLNTRKDAEIIAEKIANLFSDGQFYVDGHGYYLSPNIGIAIYGVDGTDADILLKNADEARFRVIDYDGERYFFYSDGITSTNSRGIYVKDIRDGLMKGEFFLLYQPQVSTKDEKITGMEALVRWNHPRRGSVSPIEFIPLAESSGLIIPLGYEILRMACRDYIERDFGGLKLSVNLSAYQFEQKDLVARISSILAETGMNPKNLNLEITESTTMTDMNHTMEVLRAFRNMGIQISIDDFGTGYSSLQYLKDFPITNLKIDKSFVQDIGVNTEGEKMVDYIINLAKTLGLYIVAEGVETASQTTFLRERDCDLIQGYYYSKPLDVDMFFSFLEKSA